MFIAIRKGPEDSLEFVSSEKIDKYSKGKIKKLPENLLKALHENKRHPLQITITGGAEDMNLVLRGFIPMDIPNAYCLAELTNETQEHFMKRMLKAFNEILSVAGFK